MRVVDKKYILGYFVLPEQLVEKYFTREGMDKNNQKYKSNYTDVYSSYRAPGIYYTNNKYVMTNNDKSIHFLCNFMNIFKHTSDSNKIYDIVRSMSIGMFLPVTCCCGFNISYELLEFTENPNYTILEVKTYADTDTEKHATDSGYGYAYQYEMEVNIIVEKLKTMEDCVDFMKENHSKELLHLADLQLIDYILFDKNCKVDLTNVTISHALANTTFYSYTNLRDAIDNFKQMDRNLSDLNTDNFREIYGKKEKLVLLDAVDEWNIFNNSSKKILINEYCGAMQNLFNMLYNINIDDNDKLEELMNIYFDLAIKEDKIKPFGNFTSMYSFTNKLINHLLGSKCNFNVFARPLMERSKTIKKANVYDIIFNIIVKLYNPISDSIDNKVVERTGLDKFCRVILENYNKNIKKFKKRSYFATFLRSLGFQLFGKELLNILDEEKLTKAISTEGKLYQSLYKDKTDSNIYQFLKLISSIGSFKNNFVSIIYFSTMIKEEDFETYNTEIERIAFILIENILVEPCYETKTQDVSKLIPDLTNIKKLIDIGLTSFILTTSSANLKKRIKEFLDFVNINNNSNCYGLTTNSLTDLTWKSINKFIDRDLDSISNSLEKNRAITISNVLMDSAI